MVKKRAYGQLPIIIKIIYIYIQISSGRQNRLHWEGCHEFDPDTEEEAG